MLPVVSWTTSALKVVNCSEVSLNSSLWQEIKKSKLNKKILKRIMAVCGLKLSLNLYLKRLLLLEDYFGLNAPSENEKNLFFYCTPQYCLLIVTYWISTILFNINVLLISNRLHIELIIMDKLIFIIFLKKNSIKLP